MVTGATRRNMATIPTLPAIGRVFLASGRPVLSSLRAAEVISKSKPMKAPVVIPVIDEKVRIKRSSEVAAHELGGSEGGVLLHLESGRCHAIDKVGWTIWSVLDGSRSLGELADELRKRFPDAPDQLGEDVRSFAQDLPTRSLAEVVTTG